MRIGIQECRELSNFLKFQTDQENFKHLILLYYMQFDQFIFNIFTFSGGVALLRAAAKNHSRVTVICDPADYSRFVWFNDSCQV